MGKEDSLVLVPLDLGNVQQAIEMGVEVFGDKIREAISFAFRASVGILPDSDKMAADPYVDTLTYFIAMKDGKPVGFTGYYTIKGQKQDGWLGWMGILPEYRGQGLSPQLVDVAMEKGKANGVDTIRIWSTTQDDYGAARSLYREKLGFIEEPYRAGATDAAQMVVVFSKWISQKGPAVDDSFHWKNAAYPIDAERRTIPVLNAKMKLAVQPPPSRP